MKPEERFTRTLFGVIMIASVFVNWGKWVVMFLGILFIASAAYGVCWGCEISKRLFRKTT